MPAGVSMGRYLFMLGSSIVAMFCGSQLVHKHYEPLSDLDEYVLREEQRRQSLKQDIS